MTTSSASSGEPPYGGAAGKTRSRTAIFNCRCGHRFAVEVLDSIDARSRPDLVQKLVEGSLNRAQCPDCEQTVRIDARCVVHDPAGRRFVLYMPDGERHLEIEARAQLLMELARDPAGGLPDYVVNFDVAFGGDGLNDCLARGGRDSRHLEIEKLGLELGQRQQALVQYQHDLEKARDGLAEVERKLMEREGEIASREHRIESRLAELDAKLVQTEAIRKEMLEQQQEARRRAAAVEEFQKALNERESRLQPDASQKPASARFPKEIGDAEASGWFSSAVKPAATPLQESIQMAATRPPEPETAAEPAPAQPQTRPAARSRTNAPARPLATARSFEVSDADVVEEAEIVDESLIVDEKPIAPAEAPAAPISAPSSGKDRRGKAGQQRDARGGAEHKPEAASPAREPGRLDDEIRKALAGPTRRHVLIAGDRVEIFAVVPDDGLLEGVRGASVRFRIHQIEDEGGYPWIVMTAAIRPSGKDVHLFKWILDYQIRSHRRILGRLGDKCQAQLTLVGQDLQRTVSFLASSRIEGNLKSIASDLEHFFLEHADLQSPASLDESALMAKLLDELRQPMPFHARYAEEHSSQHGVLEAIADLERWTQPQWTRKLVRTYSFPLEGLASVRRRVVTRAVEMGLDLPGALPADAVSMGLADDENALVSHSLRAFLGVCRAAHDLTEQEVERNWRALVEAAIRRSVPLSLEVAEMAVDHLAGSGIDVPRAEDVALLDASDITSVDSEVLVRWLGRTTKRAASALELLRRGGEGSLEEVARAARMMSRADLLDLVPRIFAMEDVGEVFFMDGLKDDRREFRLACAIALGRLKLRSAVVPLVNAICEHDEPDWKIESLVLARYGAAAARTVEQFLRNPRGCEDRLIFLAAALAGGGCEKQLRDMSADQDIMLATLARKAVERRLVVAAEIDALEHGDTDEPVIEFFRRLESRLVSG